MSRNPSRGMRDTLGTLSCRLTGTACCGRRSERGRQTSRSGGIRIVPSAPHRDAGQRASTALPSLPQTKRSEQPAESCCPGERGARRNVRPLRALHVGRQEQRRRRHGPRNPTQADPRDHGTSSGTGRFGAATEPPRRGEGGPERAQVNRREIPAAPLRQQAQQPLPRWGTKPARNRTQSRGAPHDATRSHRGGRERPQSGTARSPAASGRGARPGQGGGSGAAAAAAPTRGSARLGPAELCPRLRPSTGGDAALTSPPWPAPPPPPGSARSGQDV